MSKSFLVPDNAYRLKLIHGAGRIIFINIDAADAVSEYSFFQEEQI